MNWFTSQEQRVIIRWLIRRDMAEVLEIERKSNRYPWDELAFTQRLAQRNCIALAAECGDAMVGFVVYELQSKTTIEITNLAVHPAWRRQGVGTAIIERLKEKIIHTNRNAVEFLVRERNTGGQLFLSRAGFRATSIVHGCYETDDDGYLFRYERQPAQTEWRGRNRISQYTDAG